MNTFEEVADKAELVRPIRSRFILYMRTRWAIEEPVQCQTGYAEEWAKRFKDGREYEASDFIGQRVLRAIDQGE